MKESVKERLNGHRQLLNELVEKFYRSEFFQLHLADFLPEIAPDEKVWILGAGKASVEMAAQTEQKYGQQVADGIVIAPQKSSVLKRVQVFEGTHPYPDEHSVSSSYELMRLAQNIPESDHVIFCLSGGASSLFCIPAGNIEPGDLQKAYRLLLQSGASIHDVNTVRRHIANTGGGKLGQLLARHCLHSFILSDVPGDGAHVIGSGPTVPDPTSFKQAFQVLKRTVLWGDMPHSVRIYLTKGMQGDIPENPHPDDVKWEKHAYKVISAPQNNARQITAYLNEKGWHADCSDEAYNDDVRAISKKICGDAISVLSDSSNHKTPAAFVYYGESTVQVKGKGKGGRNQELALISAISLEGQHPVSLLSFATDGTDGPTDAAGAIINSGTTLQARKEKLDPELFLKNNDSYHFHEEMGTLIRKGPTGNNLMDLQVVLVG